MKNTLLAAVVALAATPAMSASINFDESVDGDIGASQFQLRAGVNSISGSVGNGDDDAFSILFDDSLRFIGGKFMARLKGSNVNYNSSGVPVASGGIFQGVLSEGETEITFTDGVTTGSLFRVRSNNDDDAENNSVEYTYAFELAAVPLPASGLLLLGALAGAAAYRGRKTA